MATMKDCQQKGLRPSKRMGKSDGTIKKEMAKVGYFFLEKGNWRPALRNSLTQKNNPRPLTAATESAHIAVYLNKKGVLAGF